jgi:hypothetical protein
MSALLVVLMIAGGLGLFFLLAPRGTPTPDGYHRDFSAEERLRALVIGVLLLILVGLLSMLGLEEEKGLGGLVLGVVGIPILFLLFIAAFGRVSSD